MKALIFQAALVKSAEWKKYKQKILPRIHTDYSFFGKNRLHTLTHCAKGVNNLFKNSEFIEALNNKLNPEKKNQTITQSVFTSIYKKLLYEAKSQKFLIKQDETQSQHNTSQTFTVKKTDDTIKVFDSNNKKVTDPELLQRITNYMDENLDEIKSKTSSQRISRQTAWIDSCFSKQTILQKYQNFITVLSNLQPEDSPLSEIITEDFFKKVLTNLDFQQYKHYVKEKNYNEDLFKHFPSDVCKIIAALIVAKFEIYKKQQQHAKSEAANKNPETNNQWKKTCEDLNKKFSIQTFLNTILVKIPVKYGYGHGRGIGVLARKPNWYAYLQEVLSSEERHNCLYSYVGVKGNIDFYDPTTVSFINADPVRIADKSKQEWTKLLSSVNIIHPDSFLFIFNTIYKYVEKRKQDLSKKIFNNDGIKEDFLKESEDCLKYINQCITQCNNIMQKYPNFKLDKIKKS